MAHYRRNNDSNRDALFGQASGSTTNRNNVGGSKQRFTNNSNSNRTTTQQFTSSSTPTTTSRVSELSNNAINNPNSNVNARLAAAREARRKGGPVNVLTGPARMNKLQEAEDYREKARKAMSRTLFSKPDPIAASMFYHRAAEAYKALGENRLERLHRIASGDCQMGHGAYAYAAAEYCRAAELSACSEETIERKRAECCKLYGDAARAWENVEKERGKVAECRMKSGFSLLIGIVDSNDRQSLMNMDRKALKIIEEAVESHVPDPLNRYWNFRQIGPSAYIDTEEEGDDGNNNSTLDATKNTSPDNIDYDRLQLCEANLITSSYAHEPLQEAVHKLVGLGEYPSALYAAGAASAILENDSFATISLSRAYCIETILALAIGDVITADNSFLKIHLQKNSYLTSRECKLAEDLIRAIKMRDPNALDEARDTSASGPNRAALTNLHTSLRLLVQGLRISGVAKTSAAAAASKPKVNPNVPHTHIQGQRMMPPPPTSLPKPSPQQATSSQVQSNSGQFDRIDVPPKPSQTLPTTDAKPERNLNSEIEANFAEMDDLMNDMGLNDDDDDDDIDLT